MGLRETSAVHLDADLQPAGAVWELKLTINAETAAKLQRVARINDRSVDYEARKILEAYLKDVTA